MNETQILIIIGAILALIGFLTIVTLCCKDYTRIKVREALAARDLLQTSAKSNTQPVPIVKTFKDLPINGTFGVTYHVQDENSVYVWTGKSYEKVVINADQEQKVSEIKYVYIDKIKEIYDYVYRHGHYDVVFVDAGNANLYRVEKDGNGPTLLGSRKPKKYKNELNVFYDGLREPIGLSLMSDKRDVVYPEFFKWLYSKNSQRFTFRHKDGFKVIERIRVIYVEVTHTPIFTSEENHEY